ncbi:MAG: HAMP domain-containing sensor histidine kinase, partial [Fulvivirga sp.]|uniref:HAMP domain-containing sensor histidine kinase n=1 Tax=Fulvivirga sp. TaxID=1931237 RepID=UPI0032F07B97
MNIASFIDYFIHPSRFGDLEELRRARLLVRACWLTSLFSNSYILFSYLFGYDKGVYLMIFNVVGFIVLAFFVKTKLPIVLLGNIYVFIGAFAVIFLTHFSGGMWSAIYPWIISIPVLALLVVNRSAAIFWGVISFSVMVIYGVLAVEGYELPVEYNPEFKTLWFLSVVPGLLLIILFISFVFEHTQTKALNSLAENNAQLQEQKEMIEMQSEHLSKLVEEKDYIIRVLSHDLRSPLKNISSLVSLMEVEKDETMSHEYSKMILDASSSAQHLVNRVLEMDASNQNHMELQHEEFDVNEFLEELILGVEESAKTKNIKIVYENKAPKARVNADETYFALIFENLLSNAIKFSEKGKEVKIQTTVDNENLRVRV